MSLQAWFKFDNMLKRMGSTITFKLISTAITDVFYQKGTVTLTTYTCYGVVVPARAYDLHSNLAIVLASSGGEPMGIVSIFVSSADMANISIGDYYIDNIAQYTIVSKEKWSDDFYVLEGHVSDI